MQGNLNMKYMYSRLLNINNKMIKSYVKIMYFFKQFASIKLLFFIISNLIVQRLNVNSRSNDLNVEQLGALNLFAWVINLWSHFLLFILGSGRCFNYLKTSFLINNRIKLFSKQDNKKSFSNFKNKILNP